MYYNEESVIYYNGKFIKAKEASENPYSQSLHYGNGVFEGIRAYNTPTTEHEFLNPMNITNA